MICFEVSLNGKAITCAGHRAATPLFAVIEAAPSIPAISLELTGDLPPQGDDTDQKSVRFPLLHMRIGPTIQL